MARAVAFGLLAVATLVGLFIFPGVTGPTLQAQQLTVVTVTNSTTIGATIQVSVQLFTFPSGSVSATCPADSVLTGGGVRLSAFERNGAGAPIRATPATLLRGSFPNGNAWTAEMTSGTEFSDSFGVWSTFAGAQYTVTAYALCTRDFPQANGPGLSTASAGGRANEASDDKQARLTSEQRQRTNRSGRDDEHTEGNVMAVACDADPPTVTLANRDGVVNVVLAGDARRVCSDVGVGAYAEADGQKENERLFYADDLSVTKH